jgi:hypothetical protein
MIVKKLDHCHIQQLVPLFQNKNYMGQDTSDSAFYHKDNMLERYHNAFCTTYLSDLKNYHAFGMFDENDNILGTIACYQSADEPAWYGTQIRSLGTNNDVVKELLDAMINFNEQQGRLKFYTLWSARHIKLLRRFAFSEYNKERYDYFDEMLIPEKTRCFYNSYWQVLFNRVLLPGDTIIRCSFLKQKYRTTLPIGGSI